jgi:hypothetical protein
VQLGGIVTADLAGLATNWTQSKTAGALSDTALGALSLIAGAAGLVGLAGKPFESLDRVGHWGFPAIIATSLLFLGTLLILRAVFLGAGQPDRWGWRGLVITALAIGGMELLLWQMAEGFARSSQLPVGQSFGLPEFVARLILSSGPPELAALILLKITVAIALVRVSRLRALAMLFLGFLLAMVGLDEVSGTERFTMGTDGLLEGIPMRLAQLGLFVIADAAICVITPTLFLALYARQLGGWTVPALPALASAGLRVAAVLAIGAAIYDGLQAFGIDVILLCGFSILGVASRLLDWNRLIFYLGLSWGVLLERHTLEGMLVSDGDVGVFARSPLGGALLLASTLIIAAIVLAAAQRLIFGHREAAA